MTDRHKKGAKAVLFLLASLFVFAVTAYMGKPLLETVEDPEAFRSFAQEKGWLSRVIFVALVFFQVVVALIPGEPLEICAGIVFGSVEGTVLCLVGIFLGSAAVFFLVRKLGIKFVELFFSVEKIRSLHFLQNQRRLYTVLFLLMAIPGTPKDLISYFVPVTRISMWKWLFLTTAARIFSVVTSTVGGDALGEGKYLFAVVVFAVTCCLGLLGVCFFNRFSKKRESEKI